MKKKKGFTLIEIMIAMFIIGVLVVLSVVAIQIVQRSVRNSQRSDAINAANLWITRYNGDNQRYPSENSITFESDGMKFTSGTEEELVVELNGATAPANNTDSNGTRYCYLTEGIGGGSTFKLAAELEGGKILEVGNASIDCTNWREI